MTWILWIWKGTFPPIVNWFVQFHKKLYFWSCMLSIGQLVWARTGFRAVPWRSSMTEALCRGLSDHRLRIPERLENLNCWFSWISSLLLLQCSFSVKHNTFNNIYNKEDAILYLFNWADLSLVKGIMWNMHCSLTSEIQVYVFRFMVGTLSVVSLWSSILRESGAKAVLLTDRKSVG